MFDALLTYLKEGSKYQGLELCEIQGKETYCFLEVVKKNKELHIAKVERYPEIEDLSGLSSSNTPLFLTVNTSKVLVKQLNGNTDPNPEILVNDAFPNLDLDNFYYQVAQPGHDPIITIAKKEYVDGLIQELGASKIRIAGISLGVSPLQAIAPFMDGPVTLPNFYLKVEGNVIRIVGREGEFRERDHILNGLSVPNLYLLSFAHIYAHLCRFPILSNLTADRNGLLDSFHNRRIFNMGLRFSLVFFLGLLMANFLLFQHYHDQTVDLMGSTAYNGSERDNLKDLEAKVEEKRQRVALLDAGGRSRSSFYLDDMAKGIPGSILLDRLTYLPLAKPLRDSRPIELEGNVIWVQGVSSNDSDYSSWLESLEKKDWIATVETMGYDYITKETSNFSFKITLYEDRQ